MHLGNFIARTAALAAFTAVLAASPVAAATVATVAVTGYLGNFTVKNAEPELPCGVRVHRGCSEKSDFVVSEPMSNPFDSGPFTFYDQYWRPPEGYGGTMYTYSYINPNETGFEITKSFLYANAYANNPTRMGNLLKAWCNKTRELYDYCAGTTLKTESKCTFELPKGEDLVKSSNETNHASDDDKPGFTTADAVIGIAGSTVLAGTVAASVVAAKHCKKLRSAPRYEYMPSVRMSNLQTV